MERERERRSRVFFTLLVCKRKCPGFDVSLDEEENAAADEEENPEMLGRRAHVLFLHWACMAKSHLFFT